MKPEICPTIDASLLLRQTQEKGAGRITFARKFYERSGIAVLGQFKGEPDNRATAIVEDRNRLPAGLECTLLVARGHGIFSIGGCAHHACSSQNSRPQQESPHFQLSHHRISHPQSVIDRIRRISNLWQASTFSQLLQNGVDSTHFGGEKIRKCKRGVNAAANLPEAL
ncbi:MAG TPA: hypothetical protein VM144_19115 [Aestuariivirga sp.]|nr:hypothetical protein [Aestuariivirga sp.]